jgi:Zn-dependent protease with chaperone function
VTHDAASITADYFDGRSARARPVRLSLTSAALRIEGDDVARDVPLRDVRWPERTTHGARVVQLADGATVVAPDAAAWDAWRRTHGPRESIVVRLQQNWRGALACLAGAVLAVVAAYVWGVPWAARAAAAAMPASIDRAIGDTALATIDEHWMRPSELPAAQQAQLAAAWQRALSTLPPDTVPAHRLVFRKSRIGANAFALPGGTIVLTDELVTRVKGDTAIVVGVLGHELGHLRHRHGLRLLVQVGALGAIASVLTGDASTLLGSVPSWLGQAAYSRDAEREADAEAVRVLRAAGLSPLVMVSFFEAMARPADARDAFPLALSSHPADAQRIAWFQAAAGAR